MSVEKLPSDALVFFGATGDLAYKKIFPALQQLVKRGKLNSPVIGVAKSGWNRDQLLDRAKKSVTEYGGLDEEAFPKLVSLLRYVDGDYGDAATFSRLRADSRSRPNGFSMMTRAFSAQPALARFSTTTGKRLGGMAR